MSIELISSVSCVVPSIAVGDVTGDGELACKGVLGASGVVVHVC